MGLELPVVSAVMARLAEPEISLAAYGGVVFPLSMIIEAPIIMLLTASTALSRDWASFRFLRRFMFRIGLVLTLLHVALAFTPLYDLVVAGLIRPPPEVLGPARLGLMIMTPWTWSIAYRRFHQGVLIRFGRSHLVGVGTMIRLAANVVALTVGYLARESVPGIAVGAAAVACGVVAEAVFIGIVVRPVLRERVRPAAPAEPLRWGAFIAFYTPLALTSLLMLSAGPMVSAAVSRLPRALDSLAVWPVINGLGFTMRSLGLAFNEVVVALLDEPGARRTLRRFAWWLAGATSAALFLIALTPLAKLYFRTLASLSPELSELAASAILIAALMPGFGALQSWSQGILVHTRRTRGVTEAVVVYLLASVLVLALGLRHGRIVGVYVGLCAVVFGTACQLLWLWGRSRRALREWLRASADPGAMADS